MSLIASPLVSMLCGEEKYGRPSLNWFLISFSSTSVVMEHCWPFSGMKWWRSGMHTRFGGAELRHYKGTVVTPICRMLRAATLVTVCDHLNLALTS